MNVIHVLSNLKDFGLALFDYAALNNADIYIQKTTYSYLILFFLIEIIAFYHIIVPHIIILMLLQMKNLIKIE